jgi:hypothetical protein
MKLVGANLHANVTGLDELPGKSNYLIGNDPKKWRTNVPNYAKVKYASVYPGVDLVYYGNQGQLEYDFVVQPRVDPRSIELAIVSDERESESQSGIDNHQSSIPAPLHVDGNGDLVVGADGGEVIFYKPIVYQPATYKEPRTTNGRGRDLVEGQYVLLGDNRIAFEVANYDFRRPVVIDPVLAYSTYLGGGDYDQGDAIAVDALGNAYVTGWTNSLNFPTTIGAFDTGFGGEEDAFVSKLNAAGSALLYSTYLGGSAGDAGSGIAIDPWGNAYLTGTTESANFPVTSGGFGPLLLGALVATSTLGNVVTPSSASSMRPGRPCSTPPT